MNEFVLPRTERQSIFLALSRLKAYEKKVKADRQTKAIDSQLVYHDQCLANKVLGATKAVRRGQALR